MLVTLIRNSFFDLWTYLFFALNQVKQLSFFGILENNEYITASVDELEVFDNVRMVESAQYFYFSLNFFEYALHLDFALVQNFDSHFMLGDFIDRHYRQKYIRIKNSSQIRIFLSWIQDVCGPY